MNFTVQLGYRVEIKGNKKRHKYLDFAREHRKL